MKFERSSGILLHPTSLPGPDGIGDLGPEAYRWINFLDDAGIGLWQALPLGPTGYGDSPYQCFSAFAGNHLLISPVLLLNEGLLQPEDLDNRPDFPDDTVDFGAVLPWKISLLDKAFERFQNSPNITLQNYFINFKESQAGWLNDYALFMTLKESHGGAPWDQWPVDLRSRKAQPLATYEEINRITVEKHRFRQFIFAKQWSDLRRYANNKSIQIMGDIPIFISYDSSDAWAHPELFHLNKRGKPTVVAGVPPDYFSPTGQLWGNPLYRWDEHKKSGYSWWIQRFQATRQMFDLFRLDHFRGFAGYWEIPAGMPTAEIGQWVKGPGKDFFLSVERVLGDLPIVAEDLGVITPDVVDLRDSFNMPGMKILQFAFSGPDNPFLPHHYTRDCVAYTGTHDNDTTLGWYKTAPEEERDYCRRYLASSDDQIVWDMIRSVWSSVASIAIAPLQDFLILDSPARMNFPGKPVGNWKWRLPPGCLSPALRDSIRDLNYLYSREKNVQPK